MKTTAWGVWRFMHSVMLSNTCNYILCYTDRKRNIFGAHFSYIIDILTGYISNAHQVRLDIKTLDFHIRLFSFCNSSELWDKIIRILLEASEVCLVDLRKWIIKLQMHVNHYR